MKKRFEFDTEKQKDDTIYEGDTQTKAVRRERDQRGDSQSCERQRRDHRGDRSRYKGQEGACGGDHTGRAQRRGRLQSARANTYGLSAEDTEYPPTSEQDGEGPITALTLACDVGSNVMAADGRDGNICRIQRILRIRRYDRPSERHGDKICP